MKRGGPFRLGLELLAAAGLCLTSLSCGVDSGTVAPCEAGVTQPCTTTLGEHGNVLTCYEGVQTCIDGGWSACGYGEVTSRASREYFENATNRSLQSVSASEACADNPCDPDCKVFTEVPSEPVSALSDGVMVGSDYEWETGSLSTFPSGLVGKGLAEPCSTGNDCQFNSYCFAPVSGSCAHNKCQTGAALSASCDPCVQDIVAEFPECGVAPSSGGGGAGPSAACEHSLCEEGDELVDGCSSCVSLVCDAIPSCCTTAWDDACIAAVTSECGKTCECGTGEVAYGGRCYTHEEPDRSWADARTACMSRGAGWDLAGVVDAAENDFINSSVNDSSQTWLGMTEGMGLSTTNTWLFASGDPPGTWGELQFSSGGGGSSSVAYDFGATWKYRTHNQSPGSTWNEPSFNDNSWSSGPAQLGFGNGDEATAFAKRRRSYYFRRTFNLTALPASAELDVVYDDGYVAYLNGQEVARRNVDDTGHNATASGSDGDNATETVSIAVDDFQIGTNTMAFLVKNVTQNSNDISFDSRLVVASAATGLSWGDSWKYTSSNPGGSWTAPAFDDSGWSSGPAQLGFGEGDEATSFGSSGVSYYFRKTITLSEAIAGATLSVLYDDGYVAYVNGTEVARQNVSNTSHGSAASASAENAVSVNELDPSVFVMGANTLAVLVKNRNRSNDVSFDADLALSTASSGGGGIYENFRSGRPNASGACASYDSGNTGEWEDTNCSSSFDSVCEGPPLLEVGADPPPPAGPWAAIELGSSWKYSDGSSAPSSSWKNLGFNDSGWSTGNAHFGFGDGDETTSLSTNRASYYFRKTISIPNDVALATLQVVYDDGAEVYVNGTRVFTRNIGSTSHNSYATSTSSDNTSVVESIDTSAFVVGTNVISVLVKNVSSSSSDVSFDAALSLDLCPVGGCPPPSTWDQACVDQVGPTCGVVCDDDSPPLSIGVCLPHYPGETDPNCAGVDLSVGIPCNGRVPVCNHGQSTAPSGIRLIHFPEDFGDFATCDPDQNSGDVRECFTDEPIPAGRCISVDDCTGLDEGREIMVNPPGSEEIAECECRDNWSIYSDAACGPPICSGGASVATLSRKPVDIIFIIDNSGSMSGEIEQVQDRINEDFTDIIAASGVDYRVIMMSRYGSLNSSVGGSDYPICVSSPLGGHNCSDPRNQAVGHNPPLFYHFSTDVGSTDPLCRLIQGLSTRDELAGDSRTWTPIAPGGYDDLLRPNALKQFVVITDDDVSCSWGGYSFNDRGTSSDGTSVAAAFDNALLTLSPSQFGTSAARNYVFHSIVAMTENNPGSAPWPSTSPIQTGRCSPGSEGPGTGYQALSILTGGLRYPTCRNSDFDAVFNALATEVIEGATLSCSFDLANEGEFDPEESAVVFTPGSGAPLTFAKVADLASCGPQSFYYEDADTITLCPSTCTAVQDDPSGQISVEVGCLPPGVEYETYEYQETYESVCDPDKGVQWGFLAYDTNTPGDSSIEFLIRAGNTQAELALAPWIPLITAEAAANTQTCSFVGPSPCPVDLYDALQPYSLEAAPLMELQAVINPTTEGRESPVLNNWSVTYTCQFDH